MCWYIPLRRSNLLLRAWLQPLWQLKGLPDCGQPVFGHGSTGKGVTTHSSEALLELAHRRNKGLITCNQFGPSWKAPWTHYFIIFMCILFLSKVYQEFTVCKPSRWPNLPQVLIQIVQAFRACDTEPQSFNVWAWISNIACHWPVFMLAFHSLHSSSLEFLLPELDINAVSWVLLQSPYV